MKMKRFISASAGEHVIELAGSTDPSSFAAK